MIKGAYVEIQKGEVYAFVEEGVETTLSIKQMGFTGCIVTSLDISNIVNIQDHNQKIIIYRENDRAQDNT